MGLVGLLYDSLYALGFHAIFMTASFYSDIFNLKYTYYLLPIISFASSSFDNVFMKPHFFKKLGIDI
ncbi:MAG: hypothetical protein DRR19_15780 [Candidatus Parabeggiatoa sp. nov. 1]|nr:MAG: hypothetical protein DRR19_15780 [Gammaproteobacteria bacterium]